jgi:hypothetical protein
MRVNLVAPSPLNGNKRPMVIMQPDSDKDRETLEKLIGCDIAAGFGRNAKTMQIEHVDLFVGDSDVSKSH